VNVPPTSTPTRTPRGRLVWRSLTGGVVTSMARPLVGQSYGIKS
jgi:hypothetical protein